MGVLKVKEKIALAKIYFSNAKTAFNTMFSRENHACFPVFWGDIRAKGRTCPRDYARLSTSNRRKLYAIAYMNSAP